MKSVLLALTGFMFSAVPLLADPGSSAPMSGSLLTPAPKPSEPQAIVARSGKIIYNILLVRKSSVSLSIVPTCIVYVTHYSGESYLEEKRVNGKYNGNGAWECKFELYYNWPKASDVSKVTTNIRYQMGKDNWPAVGSVGEAGVTYGSRTLPEIPLPPNGGSASISATFHY